MATVVFSRGQQQYTAGAEQLEVAAGTVRQVIAQVVQQFPDLAPVLESGSAVSIDGEIINDPMLEPVAADSEVHFLSSISGG